MAKEVLSMTGKQRKIVEQTLLFAAARIAGHKRAAAFANVYGPLTDAYFCAEEECKQLAKKCRDGEQLKNNNGLDWHPLASPYRVEKDT